MRKEKEYRQGEKKRGEINIGIISEEKETKTETKRETEKK